MFACYDIAKSVYCVCIYEMYKLGLPVDQNCLGEMFANFFRCDSRERFSFYFCFEKEIINVDST